MTTIRQWINAEGAIEFDIELTRKLHPAASAAEQYFCLICGGDIETNVAPKWQLPRARIMPVCFDCQKLWHAKARGNCDGLTDLDRHVVAAGRTGLAAFKWSIANVEAI